MNKSEIKQIAKERMKGNKWNIWWPFLIIMLIEMILTNIFKPTQVDLTQVFNGSSTHVAAQTSNGDFIISLLIYIIIGILTAGYYKYILNFIRKGEFDHTLIINTIKDKWLELLIGISLTAIIISIGTVLLVVPGVIAAVGLAFVSFIIIDSDTKGVDALKKSWEMMKGYKWDYFLLILYFILLIILSIFTLFILYIWVVPYMMLIVGLYYEKLKEIKGIN